MNQNGIQILPVANGFILILPREYKNINDADVFSQAMAAAGKIMQADPVLHPENKQDEKNNLLKDEFCFIFDSMEKVLAFIADRYV